MKTPAAVFLAAAHVAALLAGFLAPYDYDQQHRDWPYAPPARIRWSGLRPLACSPGGDCSRPSPVRFFTGSRLFGVDPPGTIFLLGTDGSGRDIFSRLLYGARMSLFAGLGAALFSLGFAVPLGGLAGYRGGWTDWLVMRAGEVSMALPWLYLLLAVRAALPLHISPEGAFLLVIGIVGAAGWARPARLVRATALAVRESGYVAAARGFGASTGYLLRRHVLPAAAGAAVTQASVLTPRYVLAEATLSFLGLGVGEPVPTWGNMLAEARQYHALVSYPWLLAPGAALMAVLLAYFALADALLETDRIS
jgi:peptide/nickel transport system permease protein